LNYHPKPKQRVILLKLLVARYEMRIDELEKQVNTFTNQFQKLRLRNYSVLSSTEHSHAKPRKPPQEKKRRKGGQRDH
jgi:hypothetical protein